MPFSHVGTIFESRVCWISCERQGRVSIMVGLQMNRLPYHTPYEVAQHSTPVDCWVSVYGKVLDLTQLVQVS